MARTVRKGGRGYRLADEVHPPGMTDTEAPDGWVRNWAYGTRHVVRAEARREARQGRVRALREALADIV